MSDYRDTLAEALKAEGLDDEAVARVRAHLNANDAYVAINHDARRYREREAAKERAKAAADAMPDYAGSIAQCQAETTFHGRITEWRRCTRRPVKVRAVQTKYGRAGERERIAVCAQHARADGVYRWVRHGTPEDWRYRGEPPSADEPLEPEYLTE